MRRSSASRLSALLCGAWMVVAVIEPPGVYVCPMHSAVSHEIAVAAPAPDHGAHAGHAAPAEQTAPVNHDQHGKECMCIGDCSSTPAAIVAPMVSLVEALIDAPAGPLPALPEFAPVTRGGLVLPFANGPPTVA